MKKELAKFWDFLWHSNSVWSWALNVVLAFVIIKFLLYPLIGLVLGTQLPVVAVISDSMEHPSGDQWLSDLAHCPNGPCTQEAWYIEKGITAQNFTFFPFRYGFNKGDIMILTGEKPQNIHLGDVVVFKPNSSTNSSEKRLSYPVIHRVVAIHDYNRTYVFETKGDNNPSQIRTTYLDETNISQSQLLGVAKVKLPYLGYVKIWFSSVFGLTK